MTVDEQLLYESRVKLRQAVIAGLAALCLLAAAVLQLAGPHTKVSELTLDLIYAHKRFPLDVIGGVINGIGLTALAVTLSWLFGATRARNPGAGSYMKWLALAGAVIAAIVAILYAIVIAIKANDFVTQGNQTYQEAKHLTNGGFLVVIPVIGQAATLVLAMGFVLIAFQAMRVGLLTKFMGYLGIFTGVLVLFPIGSPVPIVQAFWLLALAYLLSGRWPTGVPPAWRSGRAEPWPSSAEMREQRIKAGAGGGRAKSAPTPAPQAVGAAAPAAKSSSAGVKRKRKRRK
ncbi:MAG: hypothetical protein JO372_14270 [Solirubrobacterales bacterium]|nr:hypothetical protein [Solirubrobacterales bacterium]